MIRGLEGMAAGVIWTLFPQIVVLLGIFKVYD